MADIKNAPPPKKKQKENLNKKTTKLLHDFRLSQPSAAEDESVPASCEHGSLTLRLLMSYIQGVTGETDQTSGGCALC